MKLVGSIALSALASTASSAASAYSPVAPNPQNWMTHSYFSYTKGKEYPDISSPRPISSEFSIDYRQGNEKRGAYFIWKLEDKSAALSAFTGNGNKSALEGYGDPAPSCALEEFKEEYKENSYLESGSKYSKTTVLRGKPVDVWRAPFGDNKAAFIDQYIGKDGKKIVDVAYSARKDNHYIKEYVSVIIDAKFEEEAFGVREKCPQPAAGLKVSSATPKGFGFLA